MDPGTYIFLDFLDISDCDSLKSLLNLSIIQLGKKTLALLGKQLGFCISRVPSLIMTISDVRSKDFKSQGPADLFLFVSGSGAHRSD